MYFSLEWINSIFSWLFDARHPSGWRTANFGNNVHGTSSIWGDEYSIFVVVFYKQTQWKKSKQTFKIGHFQIDELQRTQVTYLIGPQIGLTGNAYNFEVHSSSKYPVNVVTWTREIINKYSILMQTHVIHFINRIQRLFMVVIHRIK